MVLRLPRRVEDDCKAAPTRSAWLNGTAGCAARRGYSLCDVALIASTCRSWPRRDGLDNPSGCDDVSGRHGADERTMRYGRTNDAKRTDDTDERNGRPAEGKWPRETVRDNAWTRRHLRSLGPLRFASPILWQMGSQVGHGGENSRSQSLARVSQRRLKDRRVSRKRLRQRCRKFARMKYNQKKRNTNTNRCEGFVRRDAAKEENAIYRSRRQNKTTQRTVEISLEVLRNFG